MRAAVRSRIQREARQAFHDGLALGALSPVVLSLACWAVVLLVGWLLAGLLASVHG